MGGRKQQTPGPDEHAGSGHAIKRFTEPDEADTAGHSVARDKDDTEGHGACVKRVAEPVDDIEGHRRNFH